MNLENPSYLYTLLFTTYLIQCTKRIYWFRTIKVTFLTIHNLYCNWNIITCMNSFLVSCFCFFSIFPADLFSFLPVSEIGAKKSLQWNSSIRTNENTKKIRPTRIWCTVSYAMGLFDHTRIFTFCKFPSNIDICYYSYSCSWINDLSSRFVGFFLPKTGQILHLSVWHWDDFFILVLVGLFMWHSFYHA